MINTFGIDILPANDEQRVAALRRYQIVDTPPEEVFNNLSQLIAEVFNVPIALISLVDKERVFFKGNVGMPGIKSVERGISLCSLAVLSPEPTIITKPLEDPCLLANPLVHGDFGLRFYAGVPIVTEDGYNIGTVCIVDKKEHSFSESDKEKLVRFAKTVAHTIESRLIKIRHLEDQAEIERKSRELQQVYHEQQFLTNTVPQLVWARDNEGSVVFLNDRWATYTGLSIDALKDKGWGLVLHPDDAPRVLEAWKQAKNDKNVYEVEYRLKRHDGTYRWFLGRATPFTNEKGQVAKWYGTSTDIHDRKTFEEQLERQVALRTQDLQQQRNLLDSILKHSPSGISVYQSVCNSDGAVVDMQCILANDAAETFTGISNNERYEKTVLQLTPSLAGTALWHQALVTLKDGTPFSTEYYYQPANVWLELSIVKMDDEHLINVFRDITPVKKAQQQLEKNIEELQQANAELEHFTHAASHDMKEPIRKVHIFTDRLQQTLGSTLDDTQKHYFDRLKTAAFRMNSLIEDLLVYTKVNRGLPMIEEVNLNEVISMVENDLELEIEETGAVVEVGRLPVIEGHPRQLQQIFHNLLSNALKYRKPDELPRVKISCKEVKGADTGLKLFSEEPQSRFYQIDIQDNGIGFEQKNAERIFGVFQRLHNSEYRGSGIGLSIVRKAMQNHHGYVLAKGTPTEGSTFQLFFPRSKGKPMHQHAVQRLSKA